MTGDAAAIVSKLSDEAKIDIRDGQCIMGSDACVCGSLVKGELGEYGLASFPKDFDQACCLTPLGKEVRAYLLAQEPVA